MKEKKSCMNCWFRKAKGMSMLSNSLKKYEMDTCSLENTPLPKLLICPSWMAEEGPRGEDK